jgi:hypothetical protein
MIGNGSAVALISSTAALDADADCTPLCVGSERMPGRTGRLSSRAMRMIVKTAKVWYILMRRKSVCG